MTLKADSASGYRFSAVATLASAVAGITLLSGVVELRIFDRAFRSLVHIEPIPDARWSSDWLAGATAARIQQGAALEEWLSVVGILLFTVVALAALSALIGLFAHATARRYEVALFAVVGATRAQLRATQLRSAALNAGLALLIGVPIGLAGASLASRTWPHMRTGLSVDGWLFVSILFVSLIAALVAQVAAARMSKAGWLGDALAPEARSNPGYGAEDLRGVLLHVQVAVTFALLTAALLVWQQTRAPLIGMSARAANSVVTRLLIAEHATASQRRQIHQEVERSLRAEGEGAYAVATPGTLIGVGDSDQVLSNCGSCVLANMYAPLLPLRTQQHVVGHGFFARAGFGIKRGREFEENDVAAQRVVVNDTFANLAFQGQSPIGKTIQVGGLRGAWYTVIGVVEDIPVNALVSFTPDEHSVIRSHRPGHEPAVYFFAQDKPPAVFEIITDKPVALRVAGLSVLNSQPLNKVLTRARAPAHWFARILGALAAGAAVIAILSLGASTLISVRQRELEIAARRAVGARRRDIVSQVVKDSSVIAARGIFAGVILSTVVARALQMVLPTMKVFDLTIVLVAAAALLIVSLVAAALPARAAAEVLPAQIHT